eukprot:9524311-Alexandrium_andersonii.AAC.1
MTVQHLADGAPRGWIGTVAPHGGMAPRDTTVPRRHSASRRSGGAPGGCPGAGIGPSRARTEKATPLR